MRRLKISHFKGIKVNEYFLSFKSELFSSHLFSLLQSAINPCHSDLISKINNQLWVYARRKNPYTLCRRHNEKSEKGSDDIWSINISVLIRSSSVSFFNTFHCSERKKAKSCLAVVHQLIKPQRKSPATQHINSNATIAVSHRRVLVLL